MRCASEFLFYPKRAECLKSQVQNFTPQQRHRTFLDICRTRWIARIDGIDRFEEMLEVVTLTLQSTRDNVGGHWNIDSQNLAGSTCRKVFYLFIIASHIGTARAGIGYTILAFMIELVILRTL